MTTIVSLSTIPTRFDGLYPVLENLLAQDIKPDEVRLYIPHKFRRFPDYDGHLPDVPKGVNIVRPDEDLGPGSKVLFAAKDMQGEDCDIFFCDDDMLFEPHRFSAMLAARDGKKDICVTAAGGFIDFLGAEHAPSLRQPKAVLNKKGLDYRMKRLAQILRELATRKTEDRPYHPMFRESGYVDIAQGFGGVLVRPEFFDDALYDIPPVLWTVDDYWLSGHFERQGIPIWCLANLARPKDTSNREISALHLSIVDGAKREEANAACVKYMQDTYGIWRSE